MTDLPPAPGATEGEAALLAAEAVIRTEHPERYLARLGGHVAKMGSRGGHWPRARGSHAPPDVRNAEWSATSGTVQLNWGRWTVQAAPGTLRLRAEAADEASLQRIQDMLTARLESFGRREHLTVSWQLPGPPGTGPAPAG
jgi:hypothetical protein